VAIAINHPRRQTKAYGEYIISRRIQKRGTTLVISTGNIWQFGQFHRQDRQIIQDWNLFRVPADLEELLRILVHLLEP